MHKRHRQIVVLVVAREGLEEFDDGVEGRVARGYVVAGGNVGVFEEVAGWAVEDYHGGVVLHAGGVVSNNTWYE